MVLIFSCTKIEDAFTHKAIISCSSGSTGLPKSICISHALVHYRLLTTHIFGFRLMTLNFSSMYWISGVFSMLSSAFSVTHIITSKPFSADSFFDFVEKYKVNNKFKTALRIEIHPKQNKFHLRRFNFSQVLLPIYKVF